jgi:eukaryotic-like serine/threonine-protein kinase
METGALLESLKQREHVSADDTGFILMGELGRGGMAQVLRATQSAFCRDVALKRLTLTGAVARAAFFSEARIMGLLDHANVVPVHSWVPQADGPPMLAMKLVAGKSWREVLAAREMPDANVDEHVRTLLQVTRCVEAAHDRKILHRDLKPENVMLGAYGQVYVMDWGIGVTTDRKLAAETGILHIDEAPGPAGTPAYMAPELAEGALEQDERTDVFLLGAMLHEIATNRPLHGGPDLDTIRKHCLTGVREPFPHWVPEELRAIIDQATSVKAAQRYPSANAFAAALADYLAHREARALLELGEKSHVRMVEAVQRAAAVGAATADDERMIHTLLAELSFAAGRAAELWPAAAQANELRARAISTVFEHAVRFDQLALAERLAAECVDTAAAQQVVAQLRAAAVQREAELVALRDASRRRDFKTIGRPLGAVFIVSGLLGLIAAFISAWAIRADADRAMSIIAAAWLLVTLVPGALARLLLRRHALPNSLASPRVFGLWAAVAFACSLHGAIAWGMDGDAFADTHNQAAMLAVGFVAMGLQTRRWLLLPGALCFASALVIGLFPAHSVFLFGAMWFVVMTSVGLAFQLGATLDEDTRDQAT